MSWSANLPSPVSDPDAITAEAFTVSPPDIPEDSGPHAQFEAAVDAARELARQVTGPVRVSASGHSNADGDTGSPETLNISIAEVRDPQT